MLVKVVWFIGSIGLDFNFIEKSHLESNKRLIDMNDNAIEVITTYKQLLKNEEIETTQRNICTQF